eukprot:4246472-Pyramimonas_sp.AAC.1
MTYLPSVRCVPYHHANATLRCASLASTAYHADHRLAYATYLREHCASFFDASLDRLLLRRNPLGHDAALALISSFGRYHREEGYDMHDDDLRLRQINLQGCNLDSKVRSTAIMCFTLRGVRTLAVTGTGGPVKNEVMLRHVLQGLKGRLYRPASR